MAHDDEDGDEDDDDDDESSLLISRVFQLVFYVSSFGAFSFLSWLF